MAPNFCPLVTGLQRGRERQLGHFTLICRDSAGEQMARGGDHVVVSIIHKEKKSWWASESLSYNVKILTLLDLFWSCESSSRLNYRLWLNYNSFELKCPGARHWRLCSFTGTFWGSEIAFFGMMSVIYSPAGHCSFGVDSDQVFDLLLTSCSEQVSRALCTCMLRYFCLFAGRSSTFVRLAKSTQTTSSHVLLVNFKHFF